MQIECNNLINNAAPGRNSHRALRQLWSAAESLSGNSALFKGLRATLQVVTILKVAPVSLY
ncbi:MAG: hypothetical protein OEV42_16895 [Deltaproteobacteria bacterium]|nr:hypothetical protein [Deltaproteobacteria bacterium]